MVTKMTRCSNNNNFIITYRISNDFPVHVKKIDAAFIRGDQDDPLISYQPP